MEILWHIPTPQRADVMLSLVGEAVRRRIQSAPDFYDLISYLVSMLQLPLLFRVADVVPASRARF